MPSIVRKLLYTIWVLSLESFIFSTRQSSGTSEVLNELKSVVFGLGFVVGVDICESRACFCESPEVFGEGDMREIAFEVRFVFFAIIRVMQESVVVVEDVPFGDGVILVVRAELRQCPIGDVFAAVCAVLLVGVERERL